MKKLTEKDINTILYLYNDMKFSISKIKNMCGHSHNTIKKYLIENNVDVRGNDINSQKYSFNYEYFDNINCEEKAYWLGFMYADGHIVTEQPQLSLTLSSVDKEHILKFSNCIESNYPIKDYSGRNKNGTENKYSRLIISNKHFYETCKNKGLVPNKTEIIAFPSEINKELIRHFIRGYFDGDGCITKNSKSDKDYKLKICGTDRFLRSVHDIFLSENLLSNKKEVKLRRRWNNDTNNYYTEYGGRIQVNNILNYLYKDCTIYLDRKHELFNKITQ